jgi:hypothetical protein
LPGETPPVVEMTLTSGEMLSEQTLVALGDPENPLPLSGVEAKYNSLATRSLTPDGAESLKDAIQNITEGDALVRLIGLMK